MLFAYFFADLFRRDLLKQENLITTTMQGRADGINFTMYRHFFEPKFTEKEKLEHTLFEFSNKIGAFITYVLIQAMNPDNIGDNLESQSDQLVIECVHKAVLRTLSFIIWEFRDSIYKGINQYPRN